jgi:hypothetical protein
MECPSKSFGDEISPISSQIYTGFRRSRKGAGGSSWPISEAKADDSGDRFLGWTCRDSHAVRGLFVTPPSRYSITSFCKHRWPPAMECSDGGAGNQRCH